MSAQRKKKGARRNQPTARRLPDQEIVMRAQEIIGKDEHGIFKADAGTIRGALFRYREACAEAERLKRTNSAQTKRALGQFAQHLRMAERSELGLPEDFLLLFNVKKMREYIEQRVRMHGHEVEKVIVDETYDGIVFKELIMKRRGPRPDAHEKRLAANFALELLETFGIGPTTAKTGQFAMLAAVLWGDPNAYLDTHCRKLLIKRRETGAKLPG